MKRLKSENGAITIIVVVSILFMVSFLISYYVIVSNKVKSQKRIIQETKKIYESDKSLEEIYNSYFSNSNIINIYNVEDLLKIGTDEPKNIDGKLYTFSNDKIYLLKNNLEFNSIELDLESDWINVSDREDFTGIFDFQNNTITVTNLDGSISIYPTTSQNVDPNQPNNNIEPDQPNNNNIEPNQPVNNNIEPDQPVNNNIE